MNLKYISKYILLTLIVITTPIVANEDFDFDSITDTSFDFLDLLTESDTKNSEFDPFDNLVTDINPEDLSSDTASCTPDQVAGLLAVIKIFNISSLLNESIYKKTLVPFSRNLINYPNMQIVTYSDLADRQLTTHIFANFTPKKNYRNSTEFKPGTRIGSYLNIENRAIINLYNELRKTDPNLVPFLNINNFLKTLGDARFEERRIGLFGHYYHKINDKTYWQAKLPIFWMERNLNFTQDEKDFLNREASFLGDSNFDENAFARRHLIFDSFGIGTLELTVNRIVWEGINWTFDFGGGLLLPTDYQLARGWYGTYFNPKDSQPILNFCDVVDLSNPFSPQLKPNGQQILNNYFIGALDKLSSILLTCQHGYGKRVGLVLNAHAFWQIKPDFSFNTKYCGEFLLPHENKRFFVPKNASTETFSDIFNKLPQTTPEEQQIKLDVFQRRLTELLYPRVFTVKTFPGFIFNSVSCLQKNYRNCNFTVGTSSYFQTAEKLLCGLSREEKAFYNEFKALNESLYNFKLFGKIHRIFHTRHHNDFSISIWADGTLFNQGLGDDISIGFSFDSKF